MKIYNNPNLNRKHHNGVIAIGNFDGIHKGHREIIKNLIQQTKKSNLKSAILSFTHHPKIYFNKQKNFMINSQSKKKRDPKRLRFRLFN